MMMMMSDEWSTRGRAGVERSSSCMFKRSLAEVQFKSKALTQRGPRHGMRLRPSPSPALG